MQHDQDEIREVSIELGQIKKQHDDVKKLVIAKQDDLEKIKKEIESLGVQEQTAEGPVFQIKSRLEQLEECLDTTKLKIDEETLQKYCYSHMLERMKKDFIATKIYAADLQSSLKSKNQILEIENSKSQRTKEERLQSKSTFDSLMRNIELEQKERKKRIEELQECIKNKEESVQRRIERQKRNQDIAEAAANENKDSSELKMRESLYIQRLWNAFMRKKMEKEMKESFVIDDAFKSIKTATGVTDVQEMVRKFLTREQTYSQLLMNVSESERSIDKLKKDNEELRGRLHELKIDAGENGSGNGMMDEEIIELNQTLANVQKDYSLLQEKFKKINIVNDQVSSWSKKVYSKFSTLIQGSDGTVKPGTDIVQIFKGMNTVVVGELDKIMERARQNEGEDANMNFGEVFDDFEHKDFTAKNVRVRPISGFTHGDETRDGRQSNISKGNTEGNDEGEDNYNRLAALELEDQRKAIKTKHREALEEIRRKQAQAAKEAEAKKAKQ